ncbi:uncharacterized protein LOC134841321 [Symsagittifera roscoffensis]|uniref:uncharacterized protein LOC134841321 n=1 Tax=Symsagittifera roscoffensis TaxID=84072 RepID=UPI00307BCAC6
MSKNERTTAQSDRATQPELKGWLNVGGHQVRLYWGYPQEDRPLDEDSFLHNPPIPATCSILARLLPHSERLQPMPDYQTGYYKSATCEPNESDVRVLSHYLRHDQYPRTVREGIVQYKKVELAVNQNLDPTTFIKSELPPPPPEEEAPNEEGETNRDTMGAQTKRAPASRISTVTSFVGDDDFVNYVAEKLDRKQLPSNQATPNFVNLQDCLDYDLGSGMFVKVEQAFGLLSNNLYCSCFVRINQGNKTAAWGKSAEGFGSEYKFIVNRHDYQSLQASPRWTDKAYKVNPYYDVNSCILVQVLAMDAKYVGDPEVTKPGLVFPPEGKETLTLLPEHRMGWTALNLFKRNSVNAGVHFLPVFDEQPSPEFVRDVMQMPVVDAMIKAIKEGTQKLSRLAASITIKLYDGNFVNESDSYPLAEERSLLKKIATAGKISQKRFLETREVSVGKSYSALVLATMQSKYQKRGAQGEKYKKAEHYYEMAMSDTFFNLLEDQMMEAAMSPFDKPMAEDQFDPQSLFYDFG